VSTVHLKGSSEATHFFNRPTVVVTQRYTGIPEDILTCDRRGLCP
jgi:hypothetical protein